MSVKDNISVTLSVLVLCSCILTVGQLVVFLSSHSPLNISESSLLLNIGHFDSPWLQVCADVFLVVLFIIQHSLQNHQAVKDAFFTRDCGVFERLLYNLGSCLSLLMLMQLWQPVSSWTVWQVQTFNNSTLWWIFVIIHCIAWLQIYGGCYIMDLTELLGIKQVYHSTQGWPDPLSLKSEGLRRLYSHMRHPSFSAMTVILFFHPIMQLDRLLLAHGFVVYMILRTKVDDIDYAYQLRMLQRKRRDLTFSD